MAPTTSSSISTPLHLNQGFVGRLYHNVEKTRLEVECFALHDRGEESTTLPAGRHRT